MKRVAPSVLGKKDPWDLINDLLTKGIEIVHYDVMDGKFVSNTSFPLEELREIFSKTNRHEKDVHLMVNKPEHIVEEIISEVDMITVHYEAEFNNSLDEFIDQYKSTKKVGIAINPDTDVKEIFKYLDKVSHILLMSVIPGRGGQEFIEPVYDKIVILKEEITKRNLDVLIEIDGGINHTSGPKVFSKGVELAVSGSCLINTIDDDGINKIIGNTK